MATLPFPNWHPDTADHNGGHAQLLRNVMPSADGYTSWTDIEQFTQALPAACRGYFVARNEDGSVAIFAGTITKLYLLNNTTLA